MNLIHSTPLDFEGAKVDGLRALPFEKGLFEGAGTLESPALETEPFDELVGSWNAELPKGASIVLSVQVRSRGDWSKWHTLALWDGKGGRSLDEPADESGKVDVDTLELSRPADALRYRVTLAGGRKPPRLHRVAMALSSRGQTSAARAFAPGPWVRELDVPPRSQAAEDEDYRHDICSPTSLSMVLEFWGKRLATTKVADAVLDQRDPESARYGNWPLNIAFAATQGLRGQVTRLDGLRGLEEEIAAGRPVVASITFSEGELTGSPMRETKGHLLVVAGFTKDGDVIVRDPAGRTKQRVRRVYKRAEFEKVWAVNKRGVAYVLAPQFPQEFAVGVPTADLRRKPRLPEAPSNNDPELATQLVYGERVRATNAKGDWVEVEALEQDAWLPIKRWHHYRGWLLARELRSRADRAEPDAVVRAAHAELKPAQGVPLSVPLGTRLSIARWEGAAAQVRLLDGRRAAADTEALWRLGAPPDRLRILDIARLFLGDPYVWGGRAPGGVDCSGLSSISYRAEGVDIPRDAHEQFLKAKPVKRAELQPGDLVFLSKAGAPKLINHVMLFSGGDGLLESRQSAGKVITETFQGRFGRPLAEIESGDTLTDRSGDKPQTRAIYFGSFLTQ